MVFTSVIFIFYFLPLVLFTYFIIPKKFRNARNFILFIFSLIFYFLGEPKAIFWMIYSIAINYFCGLFIGKSNNQKLKNFLLFISILGNLSVLFYFKYMNFFINNLNTFLSTNYKNIDIIMPIGISFYTFQGLSYVIDVYNNTVNYQKNPLNIGLYISLFPQLVAGPIVRYETIEHEINNRNENINLFFIGMIRFIIGIGKKMLLANKFGIISKEVFKMVNSSSMNLSIAWFGAICYSLQIFFDFSGYSDMAIGLGNIFGFKFEENFNYPYISSSITEFWRRWHISLGSWFRDYIYIPLGGNRVSNSRHIFNILIVWILTGFWHGASWNYIIWGLYFAIILLFEKFILKNIKDKIPKFLKHIYTLFLIIIGWVIFNNEDYYDMILYLKTMFGFYSIGSFSDISFYILQYLPEFIFGIIFSTPLLKNFERANDSIISIISYFIIFLLSCISLLSSSFNPFIYFRF